MPHYEEARVNAQLSKLRSAGKNKTGTTLRMNKKNVQEKELPQELFLTRQKIKMKNAFANNMLRDFHSICHSIRWISWCFVK